MDTIEQEIRKAVDRETKAWDDQDVETLLDLFHPDMVWPWPPDPASHDPMDWVLVLGHYDRDRWRTAWQRLFGTHVLIHNRRDIRRIAVSDEGNGALAVVDIDTLWRNSEGGEFSTTMRRTDSRGPIWSRPWTPAVIS